MKFISLFAGIGGLDLGLERAGMECVAQVEIDDACLKVLQKHWPNVPRYKDVRDVGKHNLAPTDLVCGGFPCQDVSLAGVRAGLDGKRSTLWSEFARIVRELEPRWVVVENVLGLLSSDDGRFFGNILRDLAALGYDAEWDVLPAFAIGAPHRRERVFVIAYPKRTTDVEHVGVSTVFSQWESDKSKWGINWLKLVVDPGDVAPSKWQPSTDGIDTRPLLVRSDDGLPGGVDRLHQLGNAVVPQVAEWIGRRICALA